MNDEYDLEEWRRVHGHNDNLPASPEQFGDAELYPLGALSAPMFCWFHSTGQWNKMPVTRFDLENVAKDVINTVIKKNHDYGDAWQALGSVGAAARFVDKFFRIEKLANGQEALVLDEKLPATLEDLVGYGLLLLLWFKFHPQGGKPNDSVG